MNWLPRSIRWRIQLWHGAVLLLVLAGFGATAYRLQRAQEFRRLDSELTVRVTALSSALTRPQERRPLPPPPPGFGDGPEPGMRPPPPGSFQLPQDLEGLFAPTADGDFYFVAWSRTGELFGQSANAPADMSAPGGGKDDGVRSRGGFREEWHVTPPGEVLLAGVSEAVMAREMARFGGWLAALGGMVLVLGLAGGAWLAARAIAPIEDISAAATRIAAGHLDERIAVVENGSELDGLAAVLNDTFTRLDAAFAEQARFTSDAAHELRTPVSVMLAQAQLALARPRSADEYRETIATTQRAAQRMHGLIESLLSLATLDARAEPLQAQPCDLADLAREQLELIRPLADERRIALATDFATAPCAADPGRLAQVLTNLLSNAVKYSRPGDTVRLSTTRDNGHALVRITDTGPGIAPAHLPHLFERFYRADASRNRTTGGTGLGLAICKAIADAHRGTLEVTSTEGGGSTFTLRLPAAGGVS